MDCNLEESQRVIAPVPPCLLQGDRTAAVRLCGRDPTERDTIRFDSIRDKQRPRAPAFTSPHLRGSAPPMRSRSATPHHRPASLPPYPTRRISHQNYLSPPRLGFRRRHGPPRRHRPPHHLLLPPLPVPRRRRRAPAPVQRQQLRRRQLPLRLQRLPPPPPPRRRPRRRGPRGLPLQELGAAGRGDVPAPARPRAPPLRRRRLRRRPRHPRPRPLCHRHRRALTAPTPDAFCRLPLASLLGDHLISSPLPSISSICLHTITHSLIWIRDQNA